MMCNLYFNWRRLFPWFSIYLHWHFSFQYSYLLGIESRNYNCVHYIICIPFLPLSIYKSLWQIKRNRVPMLPAKAHNLYLSKGNNSNIFSYVDLNVHCQFIYVMSKGNNSNIFCRLNIPCQCNILLIHYLIVVYQFSLVLWKQMNHKFEFSTNNIVSIDYVFRDWQNQEI